MDFGRGSVRRRMGAILLGVMWGDGREHCWGLDVFPCGWDYLPGARRGGCRLMGDEDGPAISSASIIKNRDILSTTSECHRTSCTNIYLIECNE